MKLTGRTLLLDCQHIILPVSNIFSPAAPPIVNISSVFNSVAFSAILSTILICF